MTMCGAVPQIRLYQDWLAREHGLTFDSYAALWEWSTRDANAFWRSVWDYFDLESPTFATVVEGQMPDAKWFPGARVNYAQQVFRHVQLAEVAGQPAIVFEDESGRTGEIGWAELKRRTASLALELRRAGVVRGDRVAAYLPNVPDAVIALLACSSIGAVWTMCSPDMGTPAVLDRFRQTAPKVLIAADGTLYGGKRMDRSRAVEELRRGLPGLAATFVLRTAYASAPIDGAHDLEAAQGHQSTEIDAFEPEWLPFDHPLWILYSSGTTGLPKALVHGHGGVIIAGLVGNLHYDVGPSYAPNTLGERFHWYSATGWVMWNIQVGGLLSGTTICLYNGSPKGDARTAPWTPLWTFAARHDVTWFGAGAAFYISCRKAALDFGVLGDLSAIRALGTTGSPLPADVQAWGSERFSELGTQDIWWCNVSGGTDIAAAFMSGNRELPPTPGRLQCRHLGAAIEAWDEHGQAVIGEVGELVCTRPFPSMPLFLWGDDDGSRYRGTYFDEWPGIWRHGDWLTIEADGSCTISGRSDATINRHGLRMGTADVYAAVEALPEVADSLIIDLEDGQGGSTLLMFVVPASGAMDRQMEAAMTAAIRDTLSPRFVPDAFIQAPAIPRTLSGKKQELPIKRLFSGWSAEKVINPDLVDNAEVLPWYLSRAETWLARSVEIAR